MAQVPAAAPIAPSAPRHTLMLGGPGTGKTAALVNHAARLIATGPCPPEAVVMLANTRSAEAQLRARLRTKLGALGERVTVRTFHGLAADIMAQVSGDRQRLSVMAGQPQAVAQVLEDALMQAMETDARFRAQALAFFAWHLHPVRNALDFSSWDDLRAHLRTLDLRTLSGERVRSRGEWIIANWLFLHGIDYVYERPIPPALLPNGGNYRPDFFLPAHGVYIEHLGLDRAGQPPAFMDPDRYLAQLKWKRTWHATQSTRLVETCAFESAEGTLPNMLALRLAQAGVRAQPLAWEVVREKLSRAHTVSRLAALAADFLRLLGSGGETVAACRARLNQGHWRQRSASFLALMEPLAQAHQKALAEEGALDFDGLIAQATCAAQSGPWRNPFVCVCVEDAQDCSPAQAQLLRALAMRAQVFAVGDDRQALFHFAGADAGFLRRFKSFFGDDGDACDIREQRDTFRMNASLCAVAENFIAQNPRHQRPPMRAARAGEPHPVRVVWAGRAHEGASEALKQIAALAPVSSAVLLLARCGATVRTLRLGHLRRPFPHLAIDAKTIHAAKGLEADFVVILDLVEARFPSSRSGDPLLHLARGASDPYPHAEERRLLFVALTRAKHGVWLVADKDKPSPFVMEVMPMAENPSATSRPSPTPPLPPAPLQTSRGRPVPHPPATQPAAPDRAPPTCASGVPIHTPPAPASL